MVMLAIQGMTLTSLAQEPDSVMSHELGNIEIVEQQAGTSRLRGAVNATRINRTELLRAACCNLGESFTTNPSVDVSYSDATTGARQIKLLGLNGQYVQMLTENQPNFRGAASPYALGYVPGTWMKSIAVSKGAASVVQGYEGITGEIDIEYLKPEDAQGATINAYTDLDGRMELNAVGNVHLNKKLNTGILTHYENEMGVHDDDHDTFVDKPRVRQFNLMNRWDYLGDRYVFHGGASVLNESRKGGQLHHTAPNVHSLFTTLVETTRAEAYMKHGFMLGKERMSSIALLVNGSYHDMDATMGGKRYDLIERHFYARLMYENNITTEHRLDVGLSLNHDNLKQHYRLSHDVMLPLTAAGEHEWVTGGYAQYTYQPSERVTVMAGMRLDYSSVYGSFVTPRLHVKFNPARWMSMRLSAGKGYRTPHVIAENFYLMASGRQLVFEEPKQERAWNTGISTTWNIPLAGKTLKLNAEYYYTHFMQQQLVDYDSELNELRVVNAQGSSRSHTFQVDATYPIVEGLEMTAAYRLNDVRARYGGRFMEKPLNSRYKGLLTLSYKSPMVLWQVDVTLQINGGGRMPTQRFDATGQALWTDQFPTYAQLQAQVTRWFRHISLYVGAENITGYRQKRLVVGADNPWGADFDPTLVWGPTHGALLYAGVRVNLWNHH